MAQRGWVGINSCHGVLGRELLSAEPARLPLVLISGHSPWCLTSWQKGGTLRLLTTLGRGSVPREPIGLSLSRLVRAWQSWGVRLGLGRCTEETECSGSCWAQLPEEAGAGGAVGRRGSSPGCYAPGCQGLVGVGTPEQLLLVHLVQDVLAQHAGQAELPAAHQAEDQLHQ